MTLRVAEHVHAREFDGELVLLDLEGGDYFALDEIGSKFWRSVEKGHTLRAVAEALATEYDVAVTKIEGDLTTLRDDLLARGLLVEVRT